MRLEMNVDAEEGERRGGDVCKTIFVKPACFQCFVDEGRQARPQMK